MPGRIALKRELSTTLAQQRKKTVPRQLSSIFRDGWIDSQLELNHLVSCISLLEADSDGCVVRVIKVMQTFSQQISIHRLLDTLASCPHHSVETLSFVGIHMDQTYAAKLKTALTVVPNNALRSLQLCRILPSGLESICQALESPTCAALTELRLTAHRDLEHVQTERLLQVIGRNPTLETIKLYSLELSVQVPSLAQAVARAPRLVDLRLTGCNLGGRDMILLARVIRDTSRLQRLDLSMNKISDPYFLSLLLQTPSLKSICLSQNDLSGHCLSYHGDHEMDAVTVSSALAKNTGLERLFLDMNPLNGGLAQQLLQGLQHHNTTLKRLGLLTLSSENRQVLDQLRHVAALNEAGRALVRRAPVQLLSHILARVRHEPQLIMGLLQENPALWA